MKEDIALLIIGAAVGAVISQFIFWWRKRIRTKNNFGAIRAEVNLCLDFANQFLKDKIIAPSYRFPTLSYQTLFPAILSNNELKEDEAKSLMKFSNLVDSINRGIDLAASVPHTIDTVQKTKMPFLSEYNSRNRAKAEELISIQNEVRNILDKKLVLLS